MLVFKIAFRYLFALRKASTVQILSVLSFLGILLGSLAMLLVLSAFNGFEDLLKNVYHFQDPDLRIERKEGKFFSFNDITFQKIRKIDHLKAAFEILKDKASLQYGDGQMVVELFGTSPEIVESSRMKSILKEGICSLEMKGEPGAIVSVGIQHALNVSMENVFEFLKVAYPKRKKILKLGTSRIFNQLAIRPYGIIQLDENRVYLPIDKVRELMDKPEGMNFMDVYVNGESHISAVQEDLTELLGSDFVVKNENEQHSDLFKVMMVEKLFVFLALGFIILISTFNLFVSSTMLLLDKTADIKVLSALGMKPERISDVIRLTGGIITISGMLIGILIGIILCRVQQEFGFIPLGMDTTLIKDYPVEVKYQDVMGISLWVLVSGFLAMIIPGAKANKMALLADSSKI